ncbi:MAG: HD-GYP domain-containing protein [Clostridium butyricum]|nr:HD-GYP domain-containing protein [Clostridium butyricum]
MGKMIKSINFSELKDGMVVAKDIEQSGNVILKKGLKMTESIIEKLNRVYVLGKVEVYEEENEIDLEQKKKVDFNKIENEFTQISNSLKKTFGKVLNNNDDYISDIRKFSKRIQDEIKAQDLIIKNIVLHGSGDDVIYRHGVNVSALSTLLGMWLGMSESQINLLSYSAMLHDCGKIKLNSKVLNKLGKLTNQEYKEIKKHSILGYDMVKKLQYIDKSVSYGVLMHHERIDGSGYPLGIKGNEIHPFGRIIAIADVFDAINSERGYKSKKTPFEALKIIKEEGMGKLDYEYVQVFLEHIINYYLGEEVILNNGDRCKILQMNTNDIQRPLVLKDGEFIDLVKHKELYIEEILL